MKNGKKSIIIIPLHLPLKYPCDYIDQTINILKKDFLVVAYDFYNPISWKNFSKNNWQKKISQFRKNNGFIFFQAPAILPFQRFKSVNKINQFLGYILISLLTLFTKKKAIIWQFFPLITNNFLKKIFNQTFIYDCVDYLDKKIHDKNIIKKELKLIKIADYVAFNSYNLYLKKTKKLLKTNNNKFIVTYCGCDFKKFDLPFKNKKENIAIFYGVFDYRIDSKLLKYTISNNKNWVFLLIGPIDRSFPPNKDFFQILKFTNVKYLKKIAKNKLLLYLKQAKIGLISYDTSYNFVKYSNPMKAYEYLASGIPVLSTKILALENYPKDIVYTTDNYKDFSNGLNKMTKKWNYQKAKIAKKIAKENSWENKIKLILKK